MLHEGFLLGWGHRGIPRAFAVAGQSPPAAAAWSPPCEGGAPGQANFL
ncbi:hypothetical protein ALT1644_460019 [Alteromonas macleodii]